MNEKERDERLIRVEMKVENIEEDVKHIDDDIKGLNNLCKQLSDLTNELRVNTETNKEILNSIKAEHPAKRIGKVEMELEQLKQEFKDDKEQRRKWIFWFLTAVGGAIITAIMALIIL